MARVNMDHPAQHHAIEHMPHEMRANRDRIAQDFIKRTDGDGQAKQRRAQQKALGDSRLMAQDQRVNPQQDRDGPVEVRNANKRKLVQDRHQHSGIGNKQRCREYRVPMAHWHHVAVHDKQIDEDENTNWQHIRQ